MKKGREVRWWQMCAVMEVCSHEIQLDSPEFKALVIDGCEVVVVMGLMGVGRGRKGLIGFVYRYSATLAPIARLPSEFTSLEAKGSISILYQIDYRCQFPIFF